MLQFYGGLVPGGTIKGVNIKGSKRTFLCSFSCFL